MKTKTKTFTIITLLLVMFFASQTSQAQLPKETEAQKEAAALIDRNDMKSYMYFLASDELGGRETGKPGNEVAARYIQTNLIRLGLKPQSEENPFLQSIPFSSTMLKQAESYIKTINSDGRETFSTDSIISLIPLSASSEITGELVFAGYGYENKNSGYSDIKGLDMKGKIVMIMTRNPEILKSKTDRDEYLFDEKVEQTKLMTILQAGPKALIYVYDPGNKFSGPWASGLANMLGSSGAVALGDKQAISIPFKIFFVTRNGADHLISSMGSSLKQIQDKIIAENKPASAEIGGIKVQIKVAVEKKNFTGYNVIGMIEGSDPLLKNECIVYSAHFDHTGINENGEVLNGADDDASGSVALLELAESFMHMKKKPLRSIVFAWVNAEEKGLLGSRFYADNPVIPMDKTILNINIDMIGRSATPSDTGKFMGFDLTVTQPGEVQLFSGPKSSQLLKIVETSAVRAGIKVTDKGKNLPFGGSDHQSFEAKGVPFLLFHSGIHSDLHSVRDDADRIDYDKMEKVTRMLYTIGNTVANQKEKFQIDPK
jgi:hypothetical protein